MGGHGVRTRVRVGRPIAHGMLEEGLLSGRPVAGPAGLHRAQRSGIRAGHVLQLDNKAVILCVFGRRALCPCASCAS